MANIYLKVPNNEKYDARMLSGESLKSRNINR